MTQRMNYSGVAETTNWGANSCSASQEILLLLWNPKVNYHVHKSPPHDLPWARSNPVHTLCNILKIHLRLCLPHGLSPSGFPI